jgi:hypothetical protein
MWLSRKHSGTHRAWAGVWRGRVNHLGTLENSSRIVGINGYIERVFSEITFGFDDCD